MNKDHFSNSSDINYLNLAYVRLMTTALGPGIRTAIWVQGCPFNCENCISPEWMDFTVANIVDIDHLARIILDQQAIQGITISGGEPFTQVKGLSKLITLVKSKRPEITVICFTGYDYEFLLKKINNLECGEFLNNIDVLVDGKYINSLNNDLGMRGSTNQRIIHLSDRINNFDFETSPRKIELIFEDRSAILIGVPNKSVLEVFRKLPSTNER